MLLHTKRYWPEAINTMLWPYALNKFVEQLTELELGDYGVTPIDNCSVTTAYLNLKNHHTGGCQVYVLDTRLQ